MLDIDDTIVAIASARAGAMRGIVRITGPKTVETLSTVFCTLPEPNGPPCVISGVIAAGETVGEIPCELYLWPGDRSYTRQPAAELHTVSSLPVLDALLAALCRVGARLAQPGEFTMRAFLAGRLDLTQAEAVLGVIDARSQSELNVALAQLAGGLARPLHVLREQLLDLLAHLEAGLDFVEEDIQFITQDELDRQLWQSVTAIRVLQDQIGERSELSAEPRVVLRGLPNAGKSSLFNSLAGAERSIVSEVASTTRDYVSVRIPVPGRTVLLIDTAGMETGATPASIAGVAQRLAGVQVEQATIELFCIDASRPLTAWECQEATAKTRIPRIVVLTKCDQPLRAEWSEPALITSSRTGIGLSALRGVIAARLDECLSQESAVVGSTAARCLESLRRAADCLSRAQELVRGELGQELVAAEIRVALDELGLIVGAVYTDDILDRVFSRFCIGK